MDELPGTVVHIVDDIIVAMRAESRYYEVLWILFLSTSLLLVWCMAALRMPAPSIVK